MWTLEGYRIIQSIGGWANCGEYATAELALDAIINSGYALEHRIKSPSGEFNSVVWQDIIDSDGTSEYCEATLGEVCNYWPEIVGNIKE